MTTTLTTALFTVKQAATVLGVSPTVISSNLARKHNNIWREALQLSEPPGTGHPIQIRLIDIVVIRMLIDLAEFPNQVKQKLATEIYDYWGNHPTDSVEYEWFGVEAEYNNHTLVHYTPDWEILNTIKEHNG